MYLLSLAQSWHRISVPKSQKSLSSCACIFLRTWNYKIYIYLPKHFLLNLSFSEQHHLKQRKTELNPLTVWRQLNFQPTSNPAVEIHVVCLSLGVQSQFDTEFGSLVNTTESTHWKFLGTNTQYFKPLAPKIEGTSIPATCWWSWVSHWLTLGFPPKQSWRLSYIQWNSFCIL